MIDARRLTLARRLLAGYHRGLAYPPASAAESGLRRHTAAARLWARLLEAEREDLLALIH